MRDRLWAVPYAADTYYYDANPAWAPAGSWLVFDEHYSAGYDESSSPATERGIWKVRGDGTGVFASQRRAHTQTGNRSREVNPGCILSQVEKSGEGLHAYLM